MRGVFMKAPSGRRYEQILHDDFEEFLHYDGETGVWSTETRRGNLVTNAPRSVFLDGTEITSNGKPIEIDTLQVDSSILEIQSGRIPEGKLPLVRQMLRDTGERHYADNIEYYTGRINTGETWSQTYGYFEIVAKVPEGRGHWPAFWLAPADEEWPPEIDIFEAYGRGVDKATPKDNTFSQAVFFDSRDADRNPIHSVDLVNPYVLDENGQPVEPEVRSKHVGDVSVFNRTIDAADFGLDIYEQFIVYAAEWTEDDIRFYLGTDRSNLIEVFRTPTPDDQHVDMIVVANDQISSTWGWNPVAGYDHLTFAKDNTFQIDSISLYAAKPTSTVKGSGHGATIVDGPAGNYITGTNGNDIIRPGDGLDFIDLKNGSDIVYIVRGQGNNVISSFRGNDVVVLEGFHFDGVTEALDRLTQVGNDVWLTNGAYPVEPQTLIFRDTTIDKFDADNLIVRWSITPHIWSSHRIDGKWVTDTDGDGVVIAKDHGSKLSGSRHTLIGSNEGDLFFIYHGSAKIVEKPSGGVDTVHTWANLSLAPNVENIVAERENIMLIGNDQDNIIISAGQNTLIGRGGDDLYDVTAAGRARIQYAKGHGDDHVIGFDLGDSLILDDIEFSSYADFQDHIVVEGGHTIVSLLGGSLTFRDTDVEVIARSLGYAIPDDGDDRNGTNVYSDFPVSASGDRIKGTDEHDMIDGGGGSDRLNGRGGDDLLIGGDGNDILVGADGDDTLIGGEGRNRLTGGDGADVFHFETSDAGGRTIISDFEAEDQIVLEELSITGLQQSGNNLSLILSDDTEILVRGMTKNDMTDEVIVFV